MKIRVFIAVFIFSILQAANAMGDSKYTWDFEAPVPRDDQFVITDNENDSDLQGISMTDGTIILSPHYRISETPLSFIYCNEHRKYGFCDKASGFLQPPIYDHCFDLTAIDPQSPILVGLNEQYGYLNRSTGEVVIPLRYPGYCNYSEFFNGYAVIVDNIETWNTVLIDVNGNTTTFPEGITPEGYVQDNGLLEIGMWNTEGTMIYGLANAQGEVILEPKYKWIEPFQYGYASVCQGEKWGHINEQGEEIVVPQFELFADGFREGYFFNEYGIAVLHLDDDSYIQIDTVGNLIQ